MRPLELTWYPKGEDHYRNSIYLSRRNGRGEFFYLVSLASVDAKLKHFTDAELAAEYWLSHTGFWYGNGKKARLQREILTRFATHPHYSDAD